MDPAKLSGSAGVELLLKKKIHVPPHYIKSRHSIKFLFYKQTPKKLPTTINKHAGDERKYEAE
jgi:hypothetical protein